MMMLASLFIIYLSIFILVPFLIFVNGGGGGEIKIYLLMYKMVLRNHPHGFAHMS